MGAHQKIDRVARRHLAQILGDKNIFPKIRAILRFEGKDGPDGIKRKSPARDEPWHFYSPFNDDDFSLEVLISEHYDLLVKHLKEGNNERAAFEAAWLSHAIVDGLTPAHHYPYEEKLAELRNGEGNETRTSLKHKIVLPGGKPSERVRNNWKMWGPKGLLTTHGFFEFGVASIMAPLSFGDAQLTSDDMKKILDIGIAEWFRRVAREIAVLDMYDRYIEKGWSTKLTLDVRNKLIPSIIKAVEAAWYAAMVDAGLVKAPKK